MKKIAIAIIALLICSSFALAQEIDEGAEYDYNAVDENATYVEPNATEEYQEAQDSEEEVVSDLEEESEEVLP